MLSKENTNQIKGVAILCMLLFHLFGFPERIPQENVQPWMGNPVTKAMQICVPVYLFMAGYGLSCVARKQEVTWISILKRLKKLYISYWWVAVPFTGVGVAIGYYDTDYCNILSAIIGINTSFINGEWWFYSLYVELLLTFYFISRIKLCRTGYMILMIIILLASRILIKILPLDETFTVFRHIKMWLIDINIFMLGCFFAKFDIFNAIVKRFNILSRSYFMPVMLVIPVLGRAYIPMIGITELVLVPIFICGIVKLSEIGGGKIWVFLGRHSMNLWLIHSFFIYYYLSSFTMAINSPLFMLIVVLSGSLACSICCEYLKACVKKFTRISF